MLARSQRQAPHVARLIAAMMVGAAHNTLRQISHDPNLDRDHAAQLVTSFCFAAVKGLDPHLIDEQTLVRSGAAAKSARKAPDWRSSLARNSGISVAASAGALGDADDDARDPKQPA